MYNNNDNRKKIEKIPVRASKHNECLNCENYKRKIIESEQTVSSRDVLIHMLQGEIQKLENKYKKSIDDYEKLRYVHCTTLQELTSLNEINKNFEDGRAKFALGRTSNLESEVEVTQKGGQTDQYTSQVASVQWNCCLNKLTTNNSSKNPTYTATTLDQNESPEDLLFKFLEEVKQSNCYKENFSNDQVYAVVSDMNKQIQDLNGLMAKLQIEFSTIITNTQNQLEKANESVERLKEENSQVKDQLVEKSSVLSSCLSVLEQNHCNIGNLSDNIKCIIREKDVLYQETQNLKENTTSQCMKKDQEILVMESKINSLNQEKEQLKNDLDKCREYVSRLKQELVENETKLIAERSTLSVELQQTEDSNKILGDTLTIVNDENKCNLQKIASLSSELKTVNREFESSESTLKKYISTLEKNMDEYKIKLITYEQMHSSENSDRMNEIAELHEKINFLESQAKELSLENSEYEEENKFYCQKIDSLVHDLRILEKENYKIEEDNKDCCLEMINLRKEYEIKISRYEEEIGQLKRVIVKCKTDVYFSSDEDQDQTTTQELSKASEEISRKDNEIARLQHDNDTLRTKLCNEANKCMEDQLIQNELKDTHEDIAIQKNEIPQSKHEIVAIKNDNNSEYKEQLEKALDEITNKNNEIQQLKEENNKIKMEICNEESNCLKKRRIEDELKKAHQEIDLKEIEIEQLKQEIATIKDTICIDNEEQSKKTRSLKQETNMDWEQRNEENDSPRRNVDDITVSESKDKQYVHFREENGEIDNQSLMETLEITKKEINLKENEIIELRNEIDALKLKRHFPSNKEIEEQRKHINEEVNYKPDKDLVQDSQRKNVGNTTEDVTKLEADNKYLFNQIQELQQYCFDYNVRTEELKHKNAIMQDELTRVYEERKKLEDELLFRQNLLPKQETLQDEGNEVQDSQDECANSSELQIIYTEKQKLEEENEILRKQINIIQENCEKGCNDTQNKIELLIKENEDLKNLITQQGVKNYTVDVKMIDVNDGVLKMTEQEIKEIQTENENLKKQINELQNHIDQFDPNISCVTNKEISIAQKQIKKMLQENEYLKKKLEEIQDLFNCGQLEELPDRISSFINELKAAERKTKEFEAQNAELKTQLENLLHHFSVYSIDNESVKSKIFAMDKQLKNVNKETNDIENECVILNNQMSELQKSCSQCSDGNQEIKVEVALLNQELKKLLQERDNIENDNKTLKKLLEDQQYCSDCQCKQKTSQQKIAEAGESTTNVTASKRETESINKLITAMNEELRFVHTEKENAETENVTLKDNVNCLQKELMETCERAENQIKSLQKKIDELEKSQEEKLLQLSKYCNKIEENNDIVDNHQETDPLVNKNIFKEIQSSKTNLQEKCEDVQNVKSINESLKNELETLQGELCKRDCITSHLEECLDNSKRTLEMCHNEIKEMKNRVENLLSENGELKEQLEKYVYESEKSKAEAEALQEKLAITNKRISEKLETENFLNLQKSFKGQEEHNNLMQKYNDLKDIYEEKTKEYCKLREQYESVRKILETTSLEYEKLKTAYKDLQSSINQQISSCQAECKTPNNTDDANLDKLSSDQRMKELEIKIHDKEIALQNMQHKNDELSFEIAQLKNDVQRVISENQRLRTAMNNVFNTMVDKFKDLSINENNIAGYCRSMLESAVVEGVTDIKKQIVEPSTSVRNKCNCMSVIMSTYKNTSHDVPTCTNCSTSKEIKDVMEYDATKKFESSSENMSSDVDEDQKEKIDEVHQDSSNFSQCTAIEPFVIEPENFNHNT